MRISYHFASIGAFASLLLLAVCPAHAELDAPSAAHLAALNTTPALAGELIYRGATFAQKAAGPDPLFRYERRLATTSSGLQATHLTRDPAQELVIAESAQFKPAYQLKRVTVQNQQLGYSGVVEVSVDGKRLKYTLNDNGVVSTAEEEIDQPAVSGPTLFGFILAHEVELANGKPLPVRFVVLKEKRTYGFDIRLAPAPNGQVIYSITPSSMMIRPFIAPMRVVLDSNNKNIVRYEGRVPPMRTVGSKLIDLDARVEYSAVSPTYR